MADQELLKLLANKKVADAYQYYDASFYKLYLAKISVEALDKIIKDFKTIGEDSVRKFSQQAIQTGYASWSSDTPMKDSVDFCGVEIPISTATTKLTMEALSLLHNFFDTYAQWINAALFGEEAIPIKCVSLKRLADKLPKYSEYEGPFINDLLDTVHQNSFVFISDFNNTLKHRSQLYVSNNINISNAKGSVSIPDFAKDGRLHSKKEVLDAIKTSLNYCKKKLDDSRTYIIAYYSTNKCRYVGHRIYNPTEFALFDSREDFEHMRNVKNHYVYLEVDPKSVKSEYQIMITYDTTDSKDGRIQLYNTPYPIIMLREPETHKIFGVIRPENPDICKIEDEYGIIYRKYLPDTKSYTSDMYNAVFKDRFTYHPMLGHMEVTYLNESADDSKKEGNINI